MAGSYKQRVYYRNEHGDVKNVCFRPVVHFTSIERQLPGVNMFKFYQNVFKTVFNVLKFYIRRNNEPFCVTLSVKPVLLAMIRAYLDEHAARFPQAHVSERAASLASTSCNLDDYNAEELIEAEEDDDILR